MQSQFSELISFPCFVEQFKLLACLEIHICWKVERDARMEPPIQTEYLRSGGAMILIFIELNNKIDLLEVFL